MLITIDDEKYVIEVPEGYTDITRVLWKDNRPGIYATNPHGKQRWFRASKIKNMKIADRKKYEQA